MSRKRKFKMSLMFVFIVSMLLSGCGTGTTEDFHLGGSCTDILNRIYAKADIDDEMREALDNYVAMAIPEENEEYILGTTEVEYTDSVVSMPMVNVDPYQCVLLRIEDADDVDEIKQTLADNANLHKWVCVEAESMVIESVGDVILYIMADQKTAAAVRDAFLSLQ